MRGVAVLLSLMLGMLGAPRASAGEAEVPESVRAMLEGLREARAKGGMRVAALFDASAIVKRIEGALPQDDSHAGAVLMLRIAIPLALAQPDFLGPIVRQRIVSWRPPGAGEAGVAVVRVVDSDDVSTAERYWLLPHGEGWRIVDLEVVELGMPLSLLLMTGLSEAFKGDRKLEGYIARLMEAREHLDAGALAEAEAKLTVEPGFRPSPTLEAVRHVFRGAVRVALERSEDALADADQALRLNPDLPLAQLIRGQALYGLERYQEAVEALRAYVALVGDDPDACELLGATLVLLDRPAEAADAALRGLSEDPTSVDLLYVAASGVPAARRTEALAALQRHPDWPEVVGEIVELELAMDLPAQAVEIAAEALNASVPESAWAAAYAAAWMLRSDREVQGRSALLELLERSDLDDLREPVRELLLASLENATAEDLASALARAPKADRPYLFTGLAAGRAQALDGAGLGALLVKARALQDVGPDLAYFEADLAVLEKRYGDALRWLDRLQVPDPLPPDAHGLLDSVLTAWPLELRVRCLIRMGRAEEALVPAQRYEVVYESQRFLLVVHAALGHAQAASAAFDACVAEEFDPAQLLEDPDAGPLLKGPAYKTLRAKHGLGE